MSVNKTSIVYVGRLPAVQVAMDRGIIKFENRKPKMVSDADAKKLLGGPDFLREDDFQKTLEEVVRSGEVVLKRGGALGDLIMLRAGVSALHRLNPGYKFALECDRRFSDVFAEDPLWSKVGKNAPRFNLEQVAEADHRGVEKHRLELFWSAMTSRKLDIHPSDWDVPCPDETVAYIDKWLRARGLFEAAAARRPFVAVQLRGSGKMKSLPDHQMRKLVERLAETCDVFLVEHDVSKVWKAEHVHSMAGRDALHSIEILRRCDLCVCFDSGALWMAHVAECPVLCIMGPTRPEQRLKYHPLADLTSSPRYDRGRVQAVLLNERIVVDQRSGKPGCEPCFEKAEKCRGTYACMQRQADDVVELIVGRAMAMLGVPVT